MLYQSREEMKVNKGSGLVGFQLTHVADCGTNMIVYEEKTAIEHSVQCVHTVESLDPMILLSTFDILTTFN